MTPFTIYTANTTGAQQNTVYPNEVTVDNLSALEQAMRRDHVCAKYTGNVRGVANFQYADCIPMDCDNDHSDNPDDWKSPEDVKKAFPGVAFAVSFSRNHMKEKKGKAARPKFHCYFPIKRISSVEQYVAMKKQIRKKFPEFDANALDGGRFLFGVEDPQIMYFKGKKTVDELFILAGGRNGTLHKKACQLIKRYGEAEAKAYFDAEAAKCVPPLEQQELDAIWSSAQKYGREMSSAEGYIPPEQFSAPQEYLKKIRPEDNKAYPWTELGAGQLFADFYKDVLRYVPERKSWFYYNGVVWEQDLGNTKTMEMCKDLARHLGIYCLSIEDDKRREEYAKFCYRWQTRKMRETVIRDAQSVHTISMEEFDTDPYIFNCKNGTLHLKTMEFTPHRPEDKLTKHSDVEYNPNASCERFERFMAEITNGDQEKAKFLQKVLGYGLSGDTRFECMFIFYGATTRNGKGTLCESVLKVIGHYGCTSQAETIGIKVNKSSRAPSEDVARLAGVRFVNISEPDRSLRLDAALAGKTISLEYAERLAACLGRSTTSLFNVTTKKELYAYETMHKIKRTLRAILSHAKKQRLINDNYASADYIDFPKRPSKEIDYMNDEDAKKFYAAADAYPDIRYKTAAMILLLTGMRRGELCGLEWSNIDFKEATITIERSVTTVAGIGVVDKEPKTESSKRVIAISDKLLSVLAEYKAWYDQYRHDMGDQWKETDRLFIAECGAQIYPGTVYTWVHKVCDAAGLPHRTVHSLRHPYVKHTTKKFNSEKQKTQATKIVDLIAWVFCFCIVSYSKRSWTL